MIGSCIAHGLRTGRRNFSLVALLWFWTFLLACTAAFPAWSWFGRGFDLAPESDRLLSDFNLLAVSELGQYDRSSVMSLLNVTVFSLALLALIANPIVSGGLIENLRSTNDETTLRRFLRGGGLYFWRYLRLLVYALVTGVVVLGALAAALSPLSNRMADSAWEPGALVGGGLVALVVFLGGGLVLTALDFARVRIAVGNSHRVMRTWFSSFWFALRHLPSTLSLFLVPTLLFMAVFALYGVYLRYVPTHTLFLILLLFVVQQVVMLCRASLRVSLVSSVLEYQKRTAPPQPAYAAAPPPCCCAVEEDAPDAEEAASPLVQISGLQPEAAPDASPAVGRTDETTSD